ncbi:Uncharacterised protein [Halioglobus japonicus]|nr:Uncharacterised protein [Halioglobus japonicus]
MTGQLKTPGLINWTFYLAMTLLVVLPLSVLTVRSGAWQQGLLLYAIACFGSAALVALSLALLLLPRFAAWRKTIMLRALPAIPGTAMLIMLFSGPTAPRIHDITTDTANPPTFSKAIELRGAGSNSLDIDQDVILLQEAAYPDLQTLSSDQAFDAAYNRAVQVATDLGWEIYHEDRNAGVIEAVDTTAVMGFKDDVVIRLRTNAEGTLIDLRSVSRVGQGDIGANAQRIRAFFEAFQQQG